MTFSRKVHDWAWLKSPNIHQNQPNKKRRPPTDTSLGSFSSLAPGTLGVWRSSTYKLEIWMCDASANTHLHDLARTLSLYQEHSISIILRVLCSNLWTYLWISTTAALAPFSCSDATAANCVATAFGRPWRSHDSIRIESRNKMEVARCIHHDTSTHS